MHRVPPVAGPRVPAGTGIVLVGVGENVKGLIPRKDEGDLVGHRVHRVPGRPIVLRLRAAWKVRRTGLGVAEVHDSLRTPEIGVDGGEVDEAVGIPRGHLADAANGDDHGIVVGAQHVVHMLERRQFLEQLRFRVVTQLAEARGRDLEVERPSIRRLALDEQRGTLQARNHRGRKVGGDRRARDANRQVGAQVGHQIGAHPLRRATGERLLECGEGDPRRFDGAECDHHRALPTAARRGERNIDGAAVLPDSDTGHLHPTVGLRLRDELLHVAVRHDHQPLACVGRRSDAIGFTRREPRGPNQPGDSAELVGRERIPARWWTAPRAEPRA